MELLTITAHIVYKYNLIDVANVIITKTNLTMASTSKSTQDDSEYIDDSACGHVEHTLGPFDCEEEEEEKREEGRSKKGRSKAKVFEVTVSTDSLAEAEQWMRDERPEYQHRALRHTTKL